MPRNKTVFSSHSQVAHVWAQQSQQEGRDTNIFFEGPTLYSYGYHFKLGEFRTALDGRSVVLLNADNYSVSTAKHQSHARGAVSHLESYTLPADCWNDSEGARIFYAKQVANCLGSAKRARKHAAYHLEQAVDTATEGTAYAAAFGLDWAIDLPAEHAAALADARLERDSRLASERAYARQLRLPKLRETHDRYMAWRKGLATTCPTPWAEAASGDLLTLVASGDMVKTSGGASFPADHARRALPAVLRLLNKGGAPDAPIRLGHFSVDAAGSGVLLAGCHRVKFTEVRRLAKRLA